MSVTAVNNIIIPAGIPGSDKKIDLSRCYVRQSKAA